MYDMMPPMAANAQVIAAYGGDSFRIGHVDYTGHVLVLPTQTLAWDGQLTAESLLAVLAPVAAEAFPEILLIGTGAQHEMLTPELCRALKERGIGVDGMNTGAACRSFNVLLGESRRVAAALRAV